ncbi:MAG: MxaK protein [Piscinibacter sp.]|nr:MxaK protein [Piscinibacter sp.]
MKRISVHALFGLAAAAVATLSIVHGVRLQQTMQLNQRIIAAARSPAEAPALVASAAQPASAASRPDAAVARDAPRLVRLAHATALSKAGAFDEAFKVYSGLLEPGQSDTVSRHAQYNLGNMYLRQALAGGTRADAGPLVELAKQRYRDLLRAEPQDWDARYNLERALRVAPEEQESAAEENNQPVERRSVSLRGMTPGDLP